jgi:glutamyl-tRNA synthetase
VEWASLSYSSDYFDLAEKKCRELIENGLAYCDNTDVDLMRIERGKMLDSKCRDQSKDENLAI